MSKIKLKMDVIQTAAHGGNVSEEERTVLLDEIGYVAKDHAEVPLDIIPDSVLQNLLSDRSLTPGQRSTIEKWISKINKPDPKEVAKTVIDTPYAFYQALLPLVRGDNRVLELQLGDRWYLVKTEITFVKYAWMKIKYCQLSFRVWLGQELYEHEIQLFPSSFQDKATAKTKPFTVQQILSKLGLRFAKIDVEKYDGLCQKASDLSHFAGKAFSRTGPLVFISRHYWWQGLDFISDASPAAPDTVVTESVLETKTNEEDKYSSYTQRDREKGADNTPLIRVFSMDRKQYGYVDVRDIIEKEWEENALDKLILPDNMSRMLRKVFDSPNEDLFGDLVSAKAGGMVVLAQGPTGVGKTFTAEIYAEHTKRPLYVLEMAELGTDLSKVESNLQRIFRRATRWNAVLLFDEADVFMSERDSNLERSAIVGIFLRLLDYYRGLFFLTTNRPEVIDKAFKSRITLALTYPPLDAERRRKIWTSMLKKAGVKLEGDLNGIPDQDLNGRQIRNLVRLIKVVHGEIVTPLQIKEICEFSCQ